MNISQKKQLKQPVQITKVSKDEYDYFYSLSPEERIDAIGEMLGKLIDFGDVY